jgi:hypothetical protein
LPLESWPVRGELQELYTRKRPGLIGKVLHWTQTLTSSPLSDWVTSSRGVATRQQEAAYLHVAALSFIQVTIFICLLAGVTVA